MAGRTFECSGRSFQSPLLPGTPRILGEQTALPDIPGAEVSPEVTKKGERLKDKQFHQTGTGCWASAAGYKPRHSLFQDGSLHLEKSPAQTGFSSWLLKCSTACLEGFGNPSCSPFSFQGRGCSSPCSSTHPGFASTLLATYLQLRCCFVYRSPKATISVPCALFSAPRGCVTAGTGTCTAFCSCPPPTLDDVVP